MIRILFNILGTLAVILALIGVIVPILPTTPFLLLASACYMRGSPRMAKWMVSNPLFGRYLHDFHAGYGIPMKTKVVALSVMWASLAVSAYVVPLPWVRPILLVIGVGVTVYLLRYKTRMPNETDKPQLPD